MIVLTEVNSKLFWKDSSPTQATGLPPHPPESWDYRCTPSHLAIFFFVDTGLDNVAYTGLELLGSSNLPALASQSVGITGARDHAWPIQGILNSACLLLVK